LFRNNAVFVFGRNDMSVEVEIASVFRSYLGGKKTVTAEGKTVGEVLKYLSDKYPMTKNMLIDDEGKMQNRFEVYLNGESTVHKGTNTTVNDGDRIDLVYIIHGG
jgi:sulfur-carrier protein